MTDSKISFGHWKKCIPKALSNIKTEKTEFDQIRDNPLLRYVDYKPFFDILFESLKK